jgi:hypothetical protein
MLLLALAPRADCAVSATPTFVAHEVHGGFVVETPGRESAHVTSPSWLRLPGQPTFVVQDGKGTEAALWMTAPATVEVRRGASMSASFEGRVEPSWDNEAIRLTLEPAGGPALKSDVFEREDLGAGPSELTRSALLSSDLEGHYRAVLRDPEGRPVGWMRVRVGIHEDSPFQFEAALPGQVDEGLAVASAAALDDEVNFIDAETYGTHRGPLRRP